MTSSFSNAGGELSLPCSPADAHDDTCTGNWTFIDSLCLQDACVVTATLLVDAVETQQLSRNTSKNTLQVILACGI